MKKFQIIVMIFILCFTISACGAKEKINEAVTEKLIETAIDGEIDIDGVEMKLETDGETFEYGEDLDWPKEIMKDLPVPKGKIITVMNDIDNGSCSVGLVEFKLDDVRNYVEKLKELGFSGGMEMDGDDGIFFSGTNSKGDQITFTCSPDTNESSIIFIPNIN